MKTENERDKLDAIFQVQRAEDSYSFVIQFLKCRSYEMSQSKFFFKDSKRRLNFRIYTPTYKYASEKNI